MLTHSFLAAMQVQGTRDEDEDDAMPLPPPPRPGAAPGSSTAPPGAAAEESSEEDGDGGDFSIPDENTIKLAKAKRERLRQVRRRSLATPLPALRLRCLEAHRRVQTHLLDENDNAAWQRNPCLPRVPTALRQRQPR